MTKLLRAKRCLEVVAAFGGAGRTALITQYARALSTQAGKIIQNPPQSIPLDPELVHADLHRRLAGLYEEEVQKKLVVPPFKRALLHGQKSAIRDQTGDYSFIQLYEAVKRLAIQISSCCGELFKELFLPST